MLAEPSGRRSHLPALDGIRAFAVGAVLLYHGGVPGVTGGMLGVDVFFVLSGFLITSLLCGEALERGAIRLGAFWARRARRLLPALFLLLLGVALYAWVFRQTVDTASIRGDALSTLFYVANWHFVLSGQGYFAQSLAPSPLLHMWSLGVEEQYYLVWPLVSFVVMKRWGAGMLARVAAVGAAASALLMASMYLAGFSTNRLYYGTDTRAQALLVGSVLGAVASTRGWQVFSGQWASSRAGRVCGTALGATGACMLGWSWHELSGQNPFLYQGGFLLVALAAGAVVASVTSWRTSVLSRVLSLRPVTYVGRISYGLYLYHWPLFLVIDGARTGLTGADLLGVRLAVTFAVAVVSFHLVEQPIRTGSLLRRWRGLALGTGGAVATAFIVVVATIVPVAAKVPTSLTQGSPGLPHSERQELAAAHAFTTRPIRFLLVGDSVAWSAGNGLSVGDVGRYGVDVIDQGWLGCNLTSQAEYLSGVEWPADKPGQSCDTWRTHWAQEVAKYHPEVVGLLLGRFELADSVYQGSNVHLGQTRWDSVLLADLDQAVHLLSSAGAKVVIYTFPYIDPPQEQPNGEPYPDSLPSRVNEWNDLLREVAAANPETTRIVDLNRILDPAGHYTVSVDDVEVRKPDDGIHITTPGGEWLQSRLLPEVAQIGLTVRYGH